jgi:hypothetical protein
MKPSAGTVLLNDSLGVEITFPRSVFFPEDVLTNYSGRIDKNQIVGNNRVFGFTIFFNNITVPISTETKIAEIMGTPLLGNIHESKFDLNKVEFISGSKLVTVDSLKGTTLRLKICESGGERLLEVINQPAGGIIQIEEVNNNNISLSCFLLEKGMNKISIIDYTGKVQISKDFYSENNSVKKLNFDISNFSKSAYFIILETVSEKYSVKFMK